MIIDKRVNDILINALDYAKNNNHEYITPEHILYSALNDQEFVDIIIKYDGDVEELRDNLSNYLDEYISKKEGVDPQESIGFNNVLFIASQQVISSQKKVIHLEHIISAIYSLEDSYAVYYLDQEGIQKRDLLLELCHNNVEDDDYYLSEEINESVNDYVEDNDKFNKSYIEKYSIDITEYVKNKKIDPLIGRDNILQRTIQVLCRRNKNNPLHIGEAGVGKTALIYGLAKKIIDGDVPDKLKNAKIFSVDIGNLLAGTKYRGDFEERIQNLLDEIKKEEKPICFIDEIHNIVGAGSLSGGALDASNLLKPYLLEGKIKFIGISNYDEYKKHFEKDKSLNRRFEKIEVNEPTIEETVKILNGLKEHYEVFHNVVYTNSALKLAVELSNKYINDKFLPDKAIDIIDEAGAYISMNRKVSDEILKVDENVIETIVSNMCKIPKEKVEDNEVKSLKMLEESLKSKVFGQDIAIDEVVRCIKMSRAGLSDDNKPVASMLFVGPTGVGKTEIAKNLASTLGIDLIRFDMSEYSEKHAASKLIGSPPGYIGYEEGGLLTDEIRKKPNCVLLLDEVEKAHADILSVLLQVMDYATLTDNQGRKADFRNVILIMTSNAGARNIGKTLIGFTNREIKGEAITEEVKKFFTPEFRNRLDRVIVFNHINEKMAYRIANKELEIFKDKLLKKNVKLKFDDLAIKCISNKGISKEFGAREIQRVINNEIKPLFIDEILFGKLSNGGECSLSVKNNQFTINIL